MKKIFLLLSFLGIGIMGFSQATAVTNDATSVGQTQATFNADITVGGGTCYSVEFEYDTDNTYANSTKVTPDQGSTISSDQAVTYTVTGLSSGTTYYFRILVGYATANGAGITGNDKNFLTTAPSAPSVIGTDIDAGVTTTTAGNSNNSISNDGGSSITDKGVCWNTTGTPTTSDYIYSAGNGTGNWSGSMTSLTAGTTYYLRAYATNSTGTGYSTDGASGGHIEFKTKCDAPVAAAGGDIQATSFTANWASSTGGESYQLDVSELSDFSTHVAGYPQDVGNVTSYSVGSLTQDQDYYYRVAAKNDGGADGGGVTTSDYSGTESVHTLVAEPSTQATNLAWEKLSTTSFRLSWDNGDGSGRIVVIKVGTGITDPVDGVTYTANSSFGSGSDIGGGSYVVYDGSSKATSVDVTNLVDDGTEYYIRVYEYNGSSSTTNYNTNSSGNDAGGNYGKTTLPVSLLNFSAVAIEYNVLISWETASELNNDHFIIERSLDGENFDEIANVEGSGNSNILLSYEFVDKQKLNGVVYYRLTQFDYDGKSTVFNMISVNLDNKDKTIETVFVDNKLLSIDLNINTKASVSLVDANGKVSQMAILPSEGGRNVKFDMNTLSRGVYFIIVDDGANISSRKFVY